MWAAIGIASAVLVGSVLIYYVRGRRRAKAETLRNLVELFVEPQKAANDNDVRNVGAGGSFRRDVGRADHFGPFFGF
jgi:hypothetical protein